MIELYAITDHPGPPLPATLRAVPSGELAAVCAPAGEREVSAEALWRHEELVEALMEDRDLLPVRYGTLLQDEAAAVRALEERRTDLASALNRVRGAVELSLRVFGEKEAERPETGADYLRAKARSARTVRELHEPLAELARASAERPPHAENELLRAAYLVNREAVPSFVERVAALQQARPELSLLCTGPWPPYSFAAG